MPRNLNYQKPQSCRPRLKNSSNNSLGNEYLQEFTVDSTQNSEHLKDGQVLSPRQETESAPSKSGAAKSEVQDWSAE